MHRIGRTGRAGREGQAVNLVSLDEEGFMMAIEKFTKQQIPVQAFPEFMPEEGERAEPIAMGRQTLWGGAGKPPSREVMAAAAKAARQDMMSRIRDKKATEGQGKSQRGDGRGQGQGQQQPRQPKPANAHGGQPQRQGGRPQGEGRPQHARGEQRPAKGHGGGHQGGGHHGGGQPDPLRTGIDSLSARGGNRNRRHGGGGGGGGQGGGGIDPLRTSYGRIK